jgi:hypothetical protein
MLQPQSGLPGVGNTVFNTPRDIYYRTPSSDYFPLPIVLDGSKCYNTQNQPYTFIAFAGTIVGRETNANNLYAPSIIGITTVVYTSGGATITTDVPTAQAIVSRIGTSGSLNLTGGPTATGTVVTNLVTFSNVNTTSGAITISNPGVNYVAGTLIQPNDGSQTMVSVTAEYDGTKTTDWTNQNTVNAMIGNWGLYCGGILNSKYVLAGEGNITALPTSILAYVKAQIRANGVPGALFSDDFGF